MQVCATDCSIAVRVSSPLHAYLRLRGKRAGVDAGRKIDKDYIVVVPLMCRHTARVISGDRSLQMIPASNVCSRWAATGLVQ